MFLSIKSCIRARIALAGVMIAFFAFMSFFDIQDAQAVIPQTINYQSRLLTPGGLPVTSTTAIQLSFYLHPTNGSPGDAPAQAGPLVWKEVYDQVSGACSMITPDSKGYFFLKLGSCSPFPSYLDFSEIMYVGVKIGADAEASPRVQLSSHPYSLNAYRLNGFEATSTATANQLLALDNNLNFNIASGTFTGAGLFINGTSTLQQVAFTVATGTSLNLTQYLAIGAIRLDSVGTNNQTSGAYLIGVFDEFVNSNATTVQAALFDLDTAITTVSSTLYAMDLQLVTDNGNITTNWIEFAGGTTTGDILPSDDITQNLGSLDKRWGEIYTEWLSVGDWNWWLGQDVDQNFSINNGLTDHFIIATSGNIGINSSSPMYQLDVNGITRSRGQLIMGSSMLLPVTGAQAGAMLWQGFDSSPYYWDGTSWQRFASLKNLSRLWSLAGNAGTDPSIDYLGTLDAQPLIFKTSNSERMRLSSDGYLGIGTSTPLTLLHVQGGSNGGAVLTLDSDDGNGYGEDAGIIINSDYDNGSNAAYISFMNNGTQYGKIYSSPYGSGFITEGDNYFDFTNDTLVRMRIMGNGNIGISTETPVYRLDVVGDARVSAQFMLGQYAVNPATGTQAGSMVYNTASSTPFFWNGTQWIPMSGGTVANALWDADFDTGIQVEKFPDEDIIRFDVAGNEVMRIDSTPDEPLVTINSSLGGYMKIFDNINDEYDHFEISTTDVFNAFGGDLIFNFNPEEGFAVYYSSNQSLMSLSRQTFQVNVNNHQDAIRVDENAFVGLSTSSPMYRLDVAGDVRVSDQFMLGQYAVNPATGTQAGSMIYNNTDSSPYFWDGTQWIAFATGTNAGAGDLQAVTDVGNITTNWIEFAGGTSTADLGITGNLNVFGDALFINATGTNIVVAEQFLLGQYAVLPVSGYRPGAMVYNTTDSSPYFWDGTQWIAFATGTLTEMDTLQSVTDRGSTTTNSIIFAGGTSTASLEVTGDLSINGIKLNATGIDGLTSGAYLIGTFDEFANFNATTVQAALKAIDAMLSFGSASSSVFVGLTTGSYDGAFNYGGKIGYQAANSICANEYPGSHFCRTDEIIATVALTDVSALFVANTYGWIAEGPPGYTANSNDCAGYTSNLNTNLGAFWAYDPDGGGMGWLNNCQVTRKISCCR